MRTPVFAVLLALAVPAVAQEDAPPADAPPADGPTLVDVLRDDGRFGTLLGALDTAGLTDALASAGPLTVFAPTDSAFAALPEGALAALSVEDLRDVLLGHVAEGLIDGAAAAEVGEGLSLAGTAFAFVPAGDALTVNGATVLEADLEASNGIAHAIDTVLLPVTEAP